VLLIPARGRNFGQARPGRRAPSKPDATSSDLLRAGLGACRGDHDRRPTGGSPGTSRTGSFRAGYPFGPSRGRSRATGLLSASGSPGRAHSSTCRCCSRQFRARAVAGSYAFAGGLPHPTGSELRGYVEYLIAIGVVKPDPRPWALGRRSSARASRRRSADRVGNAIGRPPSSLQIGSLRQLPQGASTIAAAEHFSLPPLRLAKSAGRDVHPRTALPRPRRVGGGVLPRAGRWWTTRARRVRTGVSGLAEVGPCEPARSSSATPRRQPETILPRPRGT